MMRTVLYTSILVFICFTSIVAQTPIGKSNGIIAGVITDHNSGSKLDYATIALFSETDSLLITGGISEAGGKFKLNKLPDGQFYLEVDFIGYSKKYLNNIRLTPTKNKLDLGEIKIAPSVAQLSEIEVTANRNSISYQVDKKVIDVSKDLSAAGGTAIDALINMPSVTVDIEGNVTLRGSSNFTVLIDGQPSLLSGRDALEQIPVSQIKNIEIITNPSARYDAEGTAGIINVITKKINTRGFNALLNVMGSSVESYNLDLLISQKKNDFQWYLGGTKMTRYRKGDFTQSKETIVNDTTHFALSEGLRIGRTYKTSIRGGVEFYAGKTAIQFDLEAGDRGSGYRGDLDYSETQAKGNDIFENRDFISYDYKDLNEDFITGSIGFNHSFNSPGHKLSGSLFSTYGYSMEYFENDLKENDIQHDGQRSWEEEFRLTVRGNLDYVKPFKNKKGKLEAGYQYYSYVEDGDYSMNDYNEEDGNFYFREDYYSVYRFVRNIQALYGIIANTHGSLAYQAGIRAEHTHRVLESSESWAEHVEDRVEFFPSGHINYSFGKDNTISTSYSRRTVRPRLHFLEPYVTFADSYTARTGNPHVRPEYVNSFELGYQKDFKDNFVSLETYYRIKKDKIERVRTVYEPNVTLDSISNVGSDYSLGIELMGLIAISPWWDINISGNLFSYRIESEYKVPGVDDESLNWQSRLSNSFILGKNSRIQIDGNYVGPSVSTQGVRDAFYYANLSIQQQLFDRKLSATLGISDIFATAQYYSVQSGTGLESITSVNPKSPLFVLTLNYRFNRVATEKKQKAAGTSDLFEGSGH